MSRSKSVDFLFIAPTPFYANRGCHMRIRGEAEALQKSGYKVVITTYHAGENVKDLRITRSFLNLGAWQKGPSASWKKIPATFFLFFTALRQIARLKPKFIHCHLLEGVMIGIVAGFISRLLSLFTYKPVLIFDTQGSRAQEMQAYGMIKKGLVYEFFESLEGIALYFSHYIFTSSLQYAEILKTLFPLYSSKIHHLPDAVSLFSWSGGQEQVMKLKNNQSKIFKKLATTFSKKELDVLKDWIKNKYTVVVYTGSFSPAKGLANFISSCLPYLKENKNIRVLLGGGKIADLAVEPDLKGNLIISTSKLGLENLPYFLMLGDVAIDPKASKTTEASGKILNYMALGLPVVSFGQKNNRYFLGENASYAKDFKQFTETIFKFVGNQGLRESEGHKNLERAWTKFTWDLQMGKMLSILNNPNK